MKKLPQRPDRRHFVAAGAATFAASMLPGCTPPPGYGTQPQSPTTFTPGTPLPWINWAGNQYCHPSVRVAPATEMELADALKGARGIVRAVGSGHSFSPLVPTDDTLIATDLLSGLIRHDEKTFQTEIWAGTRLRDIGPSLASIGQALPNMPDIDYLSLGGAIATSAHATGARFGSMSSYVTGLTLVTPMGLVVECDRNRNQAIFQAARTSLGVLGIVSRVVIQNEPSFDLTEVSRIENTEDVLDSLEENFAKHRHYEFMPLPNSDLCISIETNPAHPEDKVIGEDSPYAVYTLRKLFDGTSWLPGGNRIYNLLLKLAVGGTILSVRTGPSYQIFPHVRVVRFREMEYTVPVDAGAACVREILHVIRQRNLPICFPIEFRRIKADDIWLSMFQGRDGCAISVHQFGDVDFNAFFSEIEPIFWKYEGRPHWGKLHTLTADRLAPLYSRHWRDFQEVRESIDPQGRMLNPHLRKIFGEKI